MAITSLNDGIEVTTLRDFVNSLLHFIRSVKYLALRTNLLPLNGNNKELNAVHDDQILIIHHAQRLTLRRYFNSL